MNPKPCIYLQPNYLTRTAIEAEILFALCLSKCGFWSGSVKTPPEKSPCSKKIGAKSAMLTLVYFYIIMIIYKCQQSAKRKVLLNKILLPEVFPLTDRMDGSGKTLPFGNRHDGCKEREKINRRRTICTLRINFFEATPQTACIFSKEYYRYDANGNITAEKDGPFTDEEEFVFTYSYFEEQDVYGADYGFGLDAPKETEQSNPQDLFAYRRNYTWNERNLLTKSSDKNYTVHYRYGEDGQRALKYTDEGRSETLYFNN
nr:hypothetical protein [Treponema sp. OMZ 788]